MATTRARDLLVMPVCGDEPITGWFDVVNPVLYPPGAAKRDSDTAPGCPVFGEDSVLDRGEKGSPPDGGAVRPGMHQILEDGPPVVWWDPALLDLDVEEPIALRQQRILEADPKGAADIASEANYAAWKASREDLVARASSPSMSVKTVTALAGAHGADELALTERSIQVERLPRASERPGGRRFGTLVHSLLAATGLNATREAIDAAAAQHARLVDADDEEIKAAIDAVVAALAHPIMRRAADAALKGDIRRETPVLLRGADGTIIEGVVDLAFRKETAEFAGWTVVDFKTDREFDCEAIGICRPSCLLCSRQSRRRRICPRGA